MATVIYDPLKDWWEIFRLAGGDNSKSVLDSLGNVVNTTVTQVALDQAIIDNAGGVIISPTKSAEMKHTTEQAIANPTVIALALLGHDVSISALQSMVTSTDSLSSASLPIGGIGALKSEYFVGSVPTLTIVPTISTVIPFGTSNFKGLTNASGSISITTGGLYMLLFTAAIESSNRKFIYSPTIFVNGLPLPISLTQPAVKEQTGARFPFVLSFNKVIPLAALDVLTIKHITDDAAATCEIDFSIVRLG